MHFVDLSIFILYILVMLGVGFFFHRRNKDIEDYFVGGRKLSSLHVGLSVVATDVGGGFSIGLGGLGFIMGLSGSWMLFTGLLGAWLSAVFLIPHIKSLKTKKPLYTFPQVFEHFYHPRVAFIAGIISAIGYLGFTSSQLLAGAKLADATFSGLSMNMALVIMGIVAVGYTVMGGLKAVIYTDTIQWIILMTGLILVAIPYSYFFIGGFDIIRDSLPSSFMSLTNLSWQTLVNWFVTIVPIWFVGMTLYQRIYACKSAKDAKKAWYIAGIFEWPVMAFMGVILGMFARVAFDNGMLQEGGITDPASVDPEMGLPLLLRNVLPIGLMGLVLSAYFSAILSTADSCLIASSGNLLSDIISKIKPIEGDHGKTLFLSKIITLGVGILSLFIAMKMRMVLELMLYSYAFMVSGLFVPVLALIIQKKPNSTAAFWSMIVGGSITLGLIISELELPFGLAPIIFGLTSSGVTYLLINSFKDNTKTVSL
jgi:SSS family solute:Na+ symporter